MVTLCKEDVGVSLILRGQIKVSAIILSKEGPDLIRVVYKIHYEGALILCRPVKSGNGLYCLDTAAQLFINVHNAKLIFIKAGLEFVRHNYNTQIIVVADNSLDIIGHTVFHELPVHVFLRVLYTVKLNGTGERNT